MARFSNPWSLREQTFLDILKWKIRGRKSRVLQQSSERNQPAHCVLLSSEDIKQIPKHGWRVVWLGHASFMLQGCGLTLLIDPIFSQYCSPIPLPTFRRHADFPCRLEDLPPIDAVLITHSHYDHLDLRTLKAIGRDTLVISADGHRDWFLARGFKNVVELPWHGSYEFQGVKVSATPARHFTARSILDKNIGHWCGFRIEGDGCDLWHAGDTSYCSAFIEMFEKNGPIDLGLIPIGAYAPREVMEPVHLDPKAAVRVFLESGCRRAIPMHWGTFDLTDEMLSDAPAELETACMDANIETGLFKPVSIGEWVYVDSVLRE